MRENTPLTRIAFWIVCILAALWAVGVATAFVIGIWQATSAVWPIAVAAAPGIFIVVALVIERLRDPEDRYYSKNVHE